MQAGSSLVTSMATIESTVRSGIRTSTLWRSLMRVGRLMFLHRRTCREINGPRSPARRGLPFVLVSVARRSR